VAAPERAEALLEEIAELYAIMLRIARHVRADDEPMTASQRLALIEVAAAGPMRLRNLAKRMNTSPATATRAVDALEQWGFVERHRDPDDRRGVLVAPTTRGARWASRRGDEVREVLARIPRDAAPSSLTRDIRKLNAALREASGHDDVSRGALLAP
jgi:DNA-binding MarR family transcriptional regulator